MLKISKTYFFIGNYFEFSTDFSCALEQSLVKGPFTEDCSSAQEKMVEKLFLIIRMVHSFSVYFLLKF